MEGIPATLAALAEPTASLRPYGRNARRGSVPAIVESLKAHGQYRPVVANRGTLTGRPGEVLAGNHTLKAAKELGWAHLAVTWVDVNDDQAARIVLVDNKTNDDAGYDERLLVELLTDLDGLEGTGYSPEELDALAAGLADADLASRDGGAPPEDADDEDAPVESGTLLALADVTVNEPAHQPAHGSRWRLGEHLLVVAKLADEHELWRDDLPGRRFAPYPDPYLTVSTLAAECSLLLVQPNRYLAGHLLDKHDAVFPGTTEQLT